MAHLNCGARWCTPCPSDWREGAACQGSDKILDEVERYNARNQLALDVYDIMFPEDYLSALPDEGEEGRARM